MSFSFGYSPILLLACVLAAGALTVWSYRRTVPPLSGWRRAVPAALRFTALTTILFLLAEPVVQRISNTERAPILAVLVDDTQSLRVTAGTADTTGAGNGSTETVRSILSSAGTVDGDVRIFAFDESLRDIGPLSSAPDSLRADGARTSLSAALDAVRSELQGENLGGIALLSDGRYNAGRNPLYVAERSSVPIYTVTLGDTTGARDVQIRRVTTNDLAYVGSELPVRVALRAAQADGEQVTVRLLQDGTVLDDETIRLPTGTSERIVSLSMTPENAGLQSLTVAVTPLPGEATERNNTATQTVRVLESKRRVLLLAGAPSPDVGAFRRVLSRDKNTDLTARVARQDGQYYEGSLPDDLKDMDVIVLVGYPSPIVSDGDLQRVAEAVNVGVPVVFAMQPNTDLGRLSSLADALPVAPEQIRTSTIEALIEPTDRGLRHPILDVENAGTAPWEQLPPLRYNETRWSASPDARVLATLQVRGMQIDNPAVVIRSRAGRRSAAILASGTWRWTNLPDDLAAARTVWPGVVSNLVRWVAAREDTRPVRVSPVQDMFSGGERVEFTGQVYNESQEPVSDASVDVTITADDGNEFPHSMEPAGNGQYTLDVGALPEGTYTYEASAERNDATLGTDRGTFSVGTLTIEYRETRADAALMRQIAERSGGVALTAADADRLPEVVRQSAGFSARTVTEEQETELWRILLFLALILTCLAGEWTLRKRFGLV